MPIGELLEPILTYLKGDRRRSPVSAPLRRCQRSTLHAKNLAEIYSDWVGQEAPMGENADIVVIKRKLKGCHLLAPDIKLAKLYEKALAGGQLRQSTLDLENIARHVLHNYYGNSPVKAVKFEITAASTTDYASVEFDPARKETPPIKVPINTFESPAQVVITIGHELIHQVQFTRDYTSIYLLGLNEIIGNFWELEAHTWEKEPTSFKWKIGQPNVRLCLTPNETKEEQLNYDYYKTRLRKSIVTLISGPRGSAYIPSLEKWINLDEWVKASWLPKNADWKTWT